MSEARLRPTLGDGRADCQRPCLCMSGRRPHRLSAVTAFQITLLVTSQECETQKPVAHPRCTLRGGDRRHAARPGEVSRGGRGASPHPRAHGPELRAPFSVVARPDRHRSLWQPAVPWQREPGAAGAAVGGGAVLPDLRTGCVSRSLTPPTPSAHVGLQWCQGQGRGLRRV